MHVHMNQFPLKRTWELVEHMTGWKRRLHGDGQEAEKTLPPILTPCVARHHREGSDQRHSSQKTEGLSPHSGHFDPRNLDGRDKPPKCLPYIANRADVLGTRVLKETESPLQRARVQLFFPETQKIRAVWKVLRLYVKKCVCVQLLSCVRLFGDFKDRRPLGFSVRGLLQARILEWVAIFSSRRSSLPRDRPGVSCTDSGFFTTETPRKPHMWRAICKSENTGSRAKRMVETSPCPQWQRHWQTPLLHLSPNLAKTVGEPGSGVSGCNTTPLHCWSQGAAAAAIFPCCPAGGECGWDRVDSHVILRLPR